MPNAFNTTNREMIIELAAGTAFRRSIFRPIVRDQVADRLR